MVLNQNLQSPIPMNVDVCFALLKLNVYFYERLSYLLFRAMMLTLRTKLVRP